jgi:hypothetical protein
MGRPPGRQNRKPKAEIPDKERLRELEERYDIMLRRLYRNPSNESLSREVRHIEIDIVRLTGEKTLDY